jgi:hypothetical protein
MRYIMKLILISQSVKDLMKLSSLEHTCDKRRDLDVNKNMLRCPDYLSLKVI